MAVQLHYGENGKAVVYMDNLKDLQMELLQVQTKMELDEQAGLGWATEDVHEAGELMGRIAKIRQMSDGSQ